MKTALITGSGGLIGSQACNFFHEKGYKIIGVDNDMRSYFFGEEASTKESSEHLKNTLTNYKHYNLDIRDYNAIEDIFKNNEIDIIIHTAAQPSHDWAAKEPITDFTINANGTLIMLELTRLYCPKSTFIYTSTNKVYGDRPNYYYNEYDKMVKGKKYDFDTPREFIITEGEKRFEAKNRITGELYSIDENLSIDDSLHSVFGASKLSADLMCQEYGKYFDMPIGIFRGGCLTGPNHAGTELHGFLSYLVKCIVHDKPYTIFGYKGKQVRDNIHSLDLLNMFWEFHKNPRSGSVYNAGGGRGNDISVLEAIDKINEIAGTNWDKYTIVSENRIGDHIWYISDLSKFKKDYPNWDITISLDETIKQMVEFEKNKLNK